LQQVENEAETSEGAVEDGKADYLSDDEHLNLETSWSSLLESLRRGVLPPEVSVLYSLCLMHEGGRNYVAKACMESIVYLPKEDNAWMTDTTTENHVSQ
jgi:hypothetical protein